MTTVIWIDWYSYHVSRFRALVEHRSLAHQISGIELVGGCGVHPGLHFRDAERMGLPISTLLPQADWGNTRQLTLALALWRKLAQLRPSAVLVPGWYTLPALASAVWAKLHGKRSIVMSETTEEDYRRVWWKESLKRMMVRRLFDYGIAGGKAHRRYLLRLGFSPERTARYYDVVDNRFYQEGADLARQSPELRRAGELPENYFLYVGRLAPEKNVNGLIRAYSAYRAKGGRWNLVLVGDGSERKALEQQVRKFGLTSCVQFAGMKTARETIPYYAFARCFVLPSIREPWGLVVNEAMASGLPLLVSNRCGCAEDLLEDGCNGYLFDPRDTSLLIDGMLRISKLSTDVIDAMGRRSREIIAGYSPENWANEVARVVQEPA